MNKIIQCPSCNTKFALNQSLLEGVESPKFHCSRCNTIFSPSEQVNEVKDISKIDNSPALPKDGHTYEKTDTNSNNEESFLNKETEEESEFEDTLSDDELISNNHSTDHIDKPQISETKASDTAWTDTPKINITPTQTEIPLNYNQDDSSLDNLKIDWPSDTGSSDYVADLSSFKENTTKNDLFSDSEKIKREEEKKLGATYQSSSIDHQNRPEVKSLLASLIEDDNETHAPDQLKRKNSDNSRFEDTVNINRDDLIESDFDFSSIRKNNKITDDKSEFTLGTNKSEGFVLGDDKKTNISNIDFNDLITNKNKEEASSEVDYNLDINLNDDIKNDLKGINSERKNSDPATNLLGTNSPSSKAQRLTSQNQGNENRSLKDTTVVSRSDITMSLSEEDNSKIKDLNFNPISEILPAHKGAIAEKKEKELSRYNFFSNHPLLYFIIAWSLPLTLLLFMFYFASSIDENKSSLANNIIKKAGLDKLYSDLLPPNELVISKLTGKITKLTSGENIVVATGNLLNLSNKEFVNVKIEARIFDRNQILISKETAYVQSMLGYDTMDRYNFDSIKSLQNTNKALNSLISQKSISPFILAVDTKNSKQGEEAKYFGVRVYSVGKRS